MNKYPDIDIASLKLSVEEKAIVLLNEISEESLKNFAQEVKLIANGKMEEYIFRVYDLYSEGARKISNYDTLTAFTDYRTGYQGKMLDWVKDHPIEMREQPISIPLRPTKPQIQSKKPIVTIGIGSAVAIGLYIFSNAWVALAAELLTLAIAYKQHRNNVEVVSKYEFDCKTYDFEIKKLKRQLVDGLIEDLVKWMQLGKSHSDSILEAYSL